MNLYIHTERHVPLRSRTPRSCLRFDWVGTCSFFETKSGASEDHRCGWFINFSFKLAVWIFKKYFQHYDFKKSIRKKKQMVPQMVPLWLDILITTCTPLYSYGPQNRCSAGRPLRILATQGFTNVQCAATQGFTKARRRR